MKKVLSLLSIVFVISSCDQMTGSGNIIRQNRETGTFSGVEAGGAFEVEIKAGASTEVIVESDDNIIAYIKTKVVGDVLEISHKGSLSFGNSHFKVFITTPTLKLINASGASNIKVINEIKNDEKINMTASGAANINALVNAPDIQVNASGASHIELTGRTRKFIAKASGSAGIKCASLKSETTEVSASGASTIRAHASMDMLASASGAATIVYSGTNNVNKKTSGAASIQSEN